MSLRHGLLGLLNYEPMTGYDLSKLFKESLGYFWHAKGSQIYRELDTMEKNGWLTSERIIQEEKPNKRVYSITDKGKEEFLRWLETYDPFKESFVPKNAYLMRVFFGAEVSRENTLALFRRTHEKLLGYIREVEALVEELEQHAFGADSEVSKYWKMTAKSGVIINKAQLEWINESIALLEGEDNVTEENDTKGDDEID